MKTNVKIAIIGGITTVLAAVIPVIISYLLPDKKPEPTHIQIQTNSEEIAVQNSHSIVTGNVNVKDEGVLIFGDHATIQKAHTKEEMKEIIDGVTERLSPKFLEMKNELNGIIVAASAILQQKERELAQKELELSQKERELAQKELEREQKRVEITRLLVEQGAEGLEVKKYWNATDNLSAILKAWKAMEGKEVRENMLRTAVKKLNELEQEVRQEEFKSSIKLGEGWIKALGG